MTEEKEPSRIEKIEANLASLNEAIAEIQIKLDNIAKELAGLIEEIETLKKEIW